MFLALAGCQIDEVDFHDDEIGKSQQATTGGPANAAHHEAVAAITILLPLQEGQDPDIIDRMDYRYCTGVLVEGKVVMTLASCLARNLEAQLDEDIEGEYLNAASVKVQFGSSATVGTEYFLDASVHDEVMSTLGLTMHRYYDRTLPGTNDVALLSLAVAPGITPVALVNDQDLPASMLGQTLELVGYGKNEDSGEPKEEFTARNAVSPVIDSISGTRVTAGPVDTCYADQGGPGFYDLGGGPVVVTLNTFHDKCDAKRQRVDYFASDFVLPFLKYASGDCAADSTCGDCQYNGVCEEQCDTRDWDCALGAFTGSACTKDGDCEEGGHCIAATDEPEYTYCSKPCTVDVDNACPSTMTCAAAVAGPNDSECIYDGISPGSQGATCSSGIDCRSGFCENLLCANPCDAADPNSCNLDPAVYGDTEYLCLPSEDGTANVCRTNVGSGGGGFCTISPAGSGKGGASTGTLGGFGLIFLVGMLLRRRK